MFSRLRQRRSEDRKQFKAFASTLSRFKIINIDYVSRTPSEREKWVWEYIDKWMYSKTSKKEPNVDSLFPSFED